MSPSTALGALPAVLILCLLSAAASGELLPCPCHGNRCSSSSSRSRHQPRGDPGMQRAASCLARSASFLPPHRGVVRPASGAMDAGSRKRPLSSSTARHEEGPSPSSAAGTRRTRPLVVVIAGPTAVGKSDAAAELCLPPVASSVLGSSTGNGRGEIISADSVQVYRGLDVGSNKPDADETARTVHHLIDVVDPPGDGTAASYSAAEWMGDASRVVGRLAPVADKAESGGGGDPGASSKESVLPVVVGGTMMYLQWLVHGRPDAVRPTDSAVERAASRIDSFREVGGEDEAWKDASEHVSSLGPVFEGRVDKLPGRDWYRLRRLLEVAYTMAERRTEDFGEGEGESTKSEDEVLRNLTEDEVYTGLRSGSLADLGYDVRCFFLCPTQRMDHFHVVDSRCETMLLRGLLTETSTLHADGRLPADSQAGRAIGYRQALSYLLRDSPRPRDGRALSQFVDDFATATRQYAKKQMQWFRRDGSFAFVPVDMGADKGTRAEESARAIAEMCRMGREEFDELLASDESVSGRTKAENEGQGRGMKYFMSRRTVLVEGGDEFDSLLGEADECTRRVQRLDGDFSPTT